MDNGCKNQPMTLYLAYKLALRNQDVAMATEYIEKLGKSASQDPKYLYACCLEAQNYSAKICTLTALKLLAEKYHFIKDSELHFPALLRSIIRVQISLLDEKYQLEADPDVVVDDICMTFESGKHSTKRHGLGQSQTNNYVVAKLLGTDPRGSNGSKIFTVLELNWFSKNAYNLGIKHTSKWTLRSISRLLDACASIIQYYPNDLPSQEMGDICLRAMFCHFLVATTHIALARPEDNIETQLQDYLVARKHIQAFEARFERLPQVDDDCHTDLAAKLSKLMIFDFEAAIHLKAWDDLGTVTRKAAGSKDLKVLQALADSLLRAQAPTQGLLSKVCQTKKILTSLVTYSVLKIIINEIFMLEKFDTHKLAKYMRCLVRITISDSSLALKVIEHVCDTVKQAAEASSRFGCTETRHQLTPSRPQIRSRMSNSSGL